MRITAENERTCAYCHKPLYGRTDQRFCNDTCRNTFNREKAKHEQKADYENLPEIFRTIKKNYELLKSHGGQRELEPNESTYFRKDLLLKDGFNPKFFTSVREIDGSLWYFCFERGWSIGEEYCLIVDVPEQAKL